MDTSPETLAGGATIWKYLLKYAWIPVLSVIGGIASYLQRVSSNRVHFTVLRLGSEIVISGFAGVLVYLFCSSLGLTAEGCAVFVGIGGHMGSRAMWFLESRFVDWMKLHNFM